MSPVTFFFKLESVFCNISKADFKFRKKLKVKNPPHSFTSGPLLSIQLLPKPFLILYVCKEEKK